MPTRLPGSVRPGVRVGQPTLRPPATMPTFPDRTPVALVEGRRWPGGLLARRGTRTSSGDRYSERRGLPLLPRACPGTWT